MAWNTRTALATVLVLTAGLAGCLGGEQATQSASTSQPPAGPGGNGTGSGPGARESATARDPYDPGWPPIDEAAIRPGADLGAHPDLDNICTANFVFSSPDNRTLYVGTAAHCLSGREVGSTVMVGGIEDAGRIAYCSGGTRANGTGVAACPPPEDCVEVVCPGGLPTTDFALVEIAPEHRSEVHPAMMGYGGPAGVDADVALGDKVLTFGNTPFRDPAGNRLDAREGYVSDRTDWFTRLRIAGHVINGDSGSPAVTPDGALGVVVATDDRASVRAQNLDRELAFLHENTDLRVEIETWPTLDEGNLPALGGSALST